MSASSLVDPSAIRSNRAGEITREQKDDIRRKLGALPGWLTLAIMALLFAAAFVVAGSILAQSTALAIGAVVGVIIVTLVITNALGGVIAAGRMSGVSVVPAPGQVVWKNNQYVTESSGRALEPITGGGDLQPGDYTFYIMRGTNWVLSAEPVGMAGQIDAPLNFEQMRAVIEKPIDFDPKQSPDRAARRVAELQRVAAQFQGADPSRVSGADMDRISELGRGISRQMSVLMAGQSSPQNAQMLSQAAAQASLPPIDSHGMQELWRALVEGGVAHPSSLEANRKGRLTGDQRAALVNDLWINLLIAVGALGLGALVAYDRFSSGDFLVMLAAGGFGLLVSVAMLLQARFGLTDWASGSARMEQTVVTKFTRTSTEHSRNPTTYYFQVNKRRFSVSKTAYEALVEGRTYRVYYTPGTKKLVNIEPA